MMGTVTLSRKKPRWNDREINYRQYNSSAGHREFDHTNLLWLCGEMEKMSEDVIDREICRRLRQFAGQVEFDLPLAVVQQIRSRSADVEIETIPEALVPFYRHYEFMIKRQRRARPFAHS
jgi:hypothetical protein